MAISFEVALYDRLVANRERLLAQLHAPVRSFTTEQVLAQAESPEMPDPTDAEIEAQFISAHVQRHYGQLHPHRGCEYPECTRMESIAMRHADGGYNWSCVSHMYKWQADSRAMDVGEMCHWTRGDLHRPVSDNLELEYVATFTKPSDEEREAEHAAMVRPEPHTEPPCIYVLMTEELPASAPVEG